MPTESSQRQQEFNNKNNIFQLETEMRSQKNVQAQRIIYNS